MSQSQQKLRWGLVGCGWVARDYVAPALRLAPASQLVALCDFDRAALESIAVDTPDARTFTGFAQLLQAPNVDAIYVATPNHLHAALTIQAARAGKHVLCEKPMALNVEEARKMVAACRENGVQYGTAFDQRFQAYHRLLQQLVAADELGAITAVRIHYACWTPPDWVPPTQSAHDNWRIDPQRAGGGALMDLAPHGLDLSQWLLGSEIVEIAALLQQRIFDYAVDDGAVVIGRFANGALLNMNVAYNCPDNFPRRTLEIVGTKAMARARNTMGQTPGGSLQIVDATSGASKNIVADAKDDISPFQIQIETFSRAVLENRAFSFAPEGDLHTMQVLAACAQRSGGHLIGQETAS